jgi:hypothetical protein
MARKTVFATIFQDSSIVWVAVVIGAVSLWVYFSKSKRNRRPHQGQGEANVDGAALASNEANSKDDVITRLRSVMVVGWKVCVCIEALEGNPGEASLSNKAKSILQELCSRHDVFVLVQECGCREEAAVLQELKSVVGLRREKVLFCTTDKGYEAFTRQLSPAVLITTRVPLAAFLSRFLPYIILVGSNAAPTNPNVTSVPSLESALS